MSAMSVAGEYRKQADRCRTSAESSRKPADRAFWLLLAENWQKLAQSVEEQRHEELQELDAD